ncbi:MAG: topoisomerase DNA-binding C4 zinc finger domain-containing protein [Desulfobacterales bacterium]|nr:topoisomerase DNA-binding C4 zinc finger domain-containing protein [Desulfobacterales bacterium]
MKISCLLLLVERENEIKNFPESPPDRYTRETFLDDIIDIGLLVDDDLMVAIQGLAQYGYLVLDSDGNYYADRSAITLAATYDNVFSGMSGLGLIAFALQTIEEVVSGRKDLKQALDNFDQALFSRSGSSSEQKIPDDTKKPNVNYASQTQIKIESKDWAEDLKRIRRDRLLKIRSRVPPKSSEPAILIQSDYTDKVVIKEIFPKSPLPPPFFGAALSQNSSERLLKNSKTSAETFSDSHIMQSGSQKPTKKDESSTEKVRPDPAEPTQKTNLKSQRDNLSKNQIVEKQKLETIQTASKPFPLITEQNFSKLNHQPEIRGSDEQTEKKISLLPKTASIEKKPVTSEHTVEKLIEAFEEELTKFCPICGKGKILRHETEKEKFYYACSNQSCSLITWGKPYHFKCPLCANPFLIEFKYGKNHLGLKCPRATCSYYQENLDSPGQESRTNSAMEIQSFRKALVKSSKKHRKFVKKRLIHRKS